MSAAVDTSAVTGAGMRRHRSKQDYATPWEFVRSVEERFGTIAVDLAAHADNAKADRFLTEAEDSLSVCWHRLAPGMLLWLNPPFARIAPWAQKCAHETRQGARVAMLVPASVGSNWFADHVLNRALVLALSPRLSFDGRNAYPKDLILAVYGTGGPTAFDVWRWKP